MEAPDAKKEIAWELGKFEMRAKARGVSPDQLLAACHRWTIDRRRALFDRLRFDASPSAGRIRGARSAFDEERSEDQVLEILATELDAESLAIDMVLELLLAHLAPESQRENLLAPRQQGRFEQLFEMVASQSDGILENRRVIAKYRARKPPSAG
jgi:hypothetical protein